MELYFAPRVGLAWDPKGDGKMSVRAGYGLSYDFVNAQFFATTTLAPPFGNLTRITGPVSFDDPWATVPGGNIFPYTLDQECSVYEFWIVSRAASRSENDRRACLESQRATSGGLRNARYGHVCRQRGRTYLANLPTESRRACPEHVCHRHLSSGRHRWVQFDDKPESAASALPAAASGCPVDRLPGPDRRWRHAKLQRFDSCRSTTLFQRRQRQWQLHLVALHRLCEHRRELRAAFDQVI